MTDLHELIQSWPRGRELTDMQLQAVYLLVQGRHDGEVAEALGISRVTVCRWRHGSPSFKATLNSLRRAIWDATRDGMRTLVSKAIAAAGDILDTPKHPDRGRIVLALLAQAPTEELGRIGPTDPGTFADELIEIWREMTKKNLLRPELTCPDPVTGQTIDDVLAELEIEAGADEIPVVQKKPAPARRRA